MKIAYSNYFESYIKLVEFKSDSDWTFVLCNKSGKVPLWKRHPLRATSKFSVFKWEEI